MGPPEFSAYILFMENMKRVTDETQSLVAHSPAPDGNPLPPPGAHGTNGVASIPNQRITLVYERRSMNRKFQIPKDEPIFSRLF
jgi:hypothetical protein